MYQAILAINDSALDMTWGWISISDIISFLVLRWSPLGIGNCIGEPPFVRAQIHRRQGVSVPWRHLLAVARASSPQPREARVSVFWEESVGKIP
jgi:hypothetical protein